MTILFIWTILIVFKSNIHLLLLLFFSFANKRSINNNPERFSKFDLYMFSSLICDKATKINELKKMFDYPSKNNEGFIM